MTNSSSSSSSEAQSLAKIDEVGRRYIFKSLAASADPWATTVELQQELSLFSSIDTATAATATDTAAHFAVTFLDMLGVSRSDLHSYLLNNMKANIISIVDKLDDAKLIVLLNETVQYIIVKELKSVPIEIIKRLKVVPDKILQYIGRKSDSVLADFPPAIKRRVWEADSTLFVSFVSSKYFEKEGSLGGYSRDIYDANEQKAVDGLVVDIVADIGPSEKLFSAVATFLIKKAFEANGNAAPTPSSSTNKRFNIYSHLLRMLVIKASIGSNKIVTLLKVYEFSRLIDSICSAGSASDQQIVALAEHLRTAMLVQVGQMTTKKTVGGAARINLRFVKDLHAIESNAFLLLLDECLDFLKKGDAHEVFFLEVGDDIAPNYTSIVKNPMSFVAINNRIYDGYYDILTRSYPLLRNQLQQHAAGNLDLKYQLFVDDVELIFSNCELYNGASSDLAQLARVQRDRWLAEEPLFRGRIVDGGAVTGGGKVKAATKEKKRESSAPLNIAVALPPPVSRPSPAVSSAPVVLRAKTREELQETLEYCWDFVVSLDYNGIFAAPVTESEAPGYSIIVTQPMDLSTVKLKIDRKKYKSVEDLNQDITLMFDNCRRFNGDEGSFMYGDYAVELQAHWLERYALVCEVLAGKVAAIAPETAAAPARAHAVAVVNSSSDIHSGEDRGEKRSVEDGERAPATKRMRVGTEATQTSVGDSATSSGNVPATSSAADGAASERALIFAKVAHSLLLKAKSGKLSSSSLYAELPQLYCEGRLLVSLCLLSDPQLQSVLRNYVAGRAARLHLSLTQQKSSDYEKSIIRNRLTLPTSDAPLLLAVQLSQIGSNTNNLLRPLDQRLARVLLPLVVLHCCRRADEGRRGLSVEAARLEGAEVLAEVLSGADGGAQHRLLLGTVAATVLGASR